MYVVGTNSSGQLGLGDLAPRDRFEVVPETRGAGVSFVAAVSRREGRRGEAGGAERASEESE